MKKCLLIITLLLAGVSNIQALQLFIKKMDGRVIVVNIDENLTIGDLKQDIFEKEGIPVTQQRIVISGNVPSDDTLLQPLEPQKLATIHLVLAAPLVKGAGRARQPLPRPTRTKYEQRQKAAVAGETAAPSGTTSRFTRGQKMAAGGLTLAALTAAALGAAGMKIRNYQNTKKRLVKKYEIGNLTPLQDKTWLATLLARYGFTGRLHALVRNNPNASLTDFAGSDPRALAELYYGKTPTEEQFNRFIQRFFKGR